MAHQSFIEASLPAGFGRNERLERIAGFIDRNRLAVLVRKGLFKALRLQQCYGLSDPRPKEARLACLDEFL